MKRLDIRLSQCFITVDDHDKALAFYRGVLGLEVRNDVGSGGMGWVTVGAPLQLDVEIVLEPPLADPNASPADKKAMAQLLAKGLLRGVIFTTDDCDATFERIRAAGAEVLQEPYDVRDCAFRDPLRQHAALQPAAVGRAAVVDHGPVVETTAATRPPTSPAGMTFALCGNRRASKSQS